ncbi:MAG TPA: methyltransferase domain-containing protein [Solirubrobacteraceae bacterium]|nr:methyltransferase domain-containing protein [Solirubrobacteraceae bacterium]
MSQVREAYDRLAPHYDLFTAHHRYEEWTATLEDLARAAGLRGKRLLDVACGTGKSFMPFLERGYAVTACDISPAMAAIAARKAAGRARVEVHDMRALPRLGEFDLVCCLDDAINHLLEEADLVAALRAMRANLAGTGVLVFDTNTLMAYRGFFASATVVQSDERVLVWDGRTPADMPAGGTADAELLALERDGDWWSRTRSAHRQRHYPEAAVRAALAAAGLGSVATYGMHLDGSVTDGFDEIANSKAVYVARASAPDDGERR